MKVLAHRGFWRGNGDQLQVRENTVDAYLAARMAGADGVELDVRRTHDGALAVFHDPVVAGVGSITDLCVSDLPRWVPLLGDALEACTGSIVNVEIKVPRYSRRQSAGELAWTQGPAIATEVVATVAQRGSSQLVLVSSFDLATVDTIKSLAPEITTGLLVGRGARASTGLALAAEHGHDALHPRQSLVTRELVEQAHHLGLDVVAWTVNSRRKLEQMRDIDVDCVITDAPDTAVDVVRASPA